VADLGPNGLSTRQFLPAEIDVSGSDSDATDKQSEIGIFG
jgi:hypothetical protein